MGHLCTLLITQRKLGYVAMEPQSSIREEIWVAELVYKTVDFNMTWGFFDSYKLKVNIFVRLFLNYCSYAMIASVVANNPA